MLSDFVTDPKPCGIHPWVMVGRARQSLRAAVICKGGPARRGLTRPTVLAQLLLHDQPSFANRQGNLAINEIVVERNPGSIFSRVRVKNRADARPIKSGK